jgi:hypothetical protein
LRSVVTEFQQYQTAVNTFKQKYFALPGDMTNATAFWGAQDGGDGLGSDCYDSASTDIRTCNGDGNGRVGEWGVGFDHSFVYYETFRFWQQLLNSGLVAGSFTGVTGVAAIDHSIIGQNVPASKLSSGGWSVEFVARGAVYPTTFDVEYGNYFNVGAATPDNSTHAPLFNAEDAWNIDKKSDDGKPGSGKIIVDDSQHCARAASATDFTSDYNLNETAIECSLVFVRAF